jgi:hypothetical protein
VFWRLNGACPCTFSGNHHLVPNFSKRSIYLPSCTFVAEPSLLDWIGIFRIVLFETKNLIGFPLVSTTVPDCHFGSGSRLEPNCRQIGGPGPQFTETVNSGMVQSICPYPSELRRSSAGPPAGPFLNTYTALPFAI